MYVSHAKGIAIVCPNRVGSRSMRAAALANGFRVVGTHHEVVPSAIPDGARVFCCIRNHWDVMLSWYGRQPTAAGKTFGEWWPKWFDDYVHMAAEAGEGWQTTHDLYSYYLEHATDVVVYPEGVSAILTAIGAEGAPVVRDGGSKRAWADRDYRTAYTAEESAMVGAQFHDEIVRLGFSFGGGLG